MLKIYIYGYLNRVPSSRRLERECQRNLVSRLRIAVRACRKLGRQYGDGTLVKTIS